MCSHTFPLIAAQVDDQVRMPPNINKCDGFESELAGLYTEGGHVDLDKVANVVQRYSGTIIPLKKPKSYSVRVCGQDDTVYGGNEEQLEAWKDFYLPERMEMVVIGAIDDFPCDAFGLQLVLLLCEDGNIYAYEDEVLHLVARNVNELFETGLTFPGLECYRLGECFEDYTEEEYNEIMESDEMKKMKQEHHNFRETLELELLELLEDSQTTEFKDEEKSTVQPKMNSDTKECNKVVLYNMQISHFCTNVHNYFPRRLRARGYTLYPCSLFHTDSAGIWKTPFSLIYISFACGRKPEYPEETHQICGEYANSMYTDTEAGIKPRPWRCKPKAPPCRLTQEAHSGHLVH
ncbi:uncharacterized protein Hap1MRO34_002685 isoform 1-T1 [Clarias gariepinus]|uniref:uncharacterized protein LOC128516068 isoform X1 n=1 Tax=Clarias gariepinus TaxID=13013 RepID=UPI00234CEAB0|nr:uncharacterized protein LOC128516068 isoform X1 [Clarias gariepinus]